MDVKGLFTEVRGVGSKRSQVNANTCTVLHSAIPTNLIFCHLRHLRIYLMGFSKALARQTLRLEFEVVLKMTQPFLMNAEF